MCALVARPSGAVSDTETRVGTSAQASGGTVTRTGTSTLPPAGISTSGMPSVTSQRSSLTCVPSATVRGSGESFEMASTASTA